MKSTSRNILGISLFGATGTGIILFASIYARDAERLLHRSAFIQLKNIYSALAGYNSQHGDLPAATSEGSQPVSWRIEAAVVKDQLTDYDRQRPWNDPTNLRLQDFGASRHFYSPFGRQRDRHNSFDTQYHTTYYKAIEGPDTAFDPDKPTGLAELPNDLIIVVRVEESDTHWMQPDDLRVEEVQSLAEGKRLLLGNNGYAVLFADGEAWWLSDEAPYGELSKFMTITNAKRFDREELLAPFKRQWRASF